MQSVTCSLQSAVCGLRSAVCGLRSAVCGLQSAVCSLQMSDTAFLALRLVNSEVIRKYYSEQPAREI